ncbi:MAG: glycosyltransferase [Acidimicrobiia bacterium]|nr:glycosyltransferase [Acidimicrobiia bacterium]MDH5519301.1 glycosyltransferase [Acidimicrobiia bacterium]
MRSRLRLFALVGAVATAVDLFLFLLLARRWSSIVASNVVALVAAATVAYTLNRRLTFKGDPRARWVSNPGLFAGTAVVAGSVDTIVLVLANPILLLPLTKMLAIGLGAGVRWFMYRWILFTQVRRDLARRVKRPVPDRPLRLTVILPAYNEEDRIAASIGAVHDTLAPVLGDDDLEILVVDDGSADGTPEVAEQAGARVLRQPSNRGKGSAVRRGVLEARGRTVLFTDADLAYRPELLLSLLDEVEQGWDMVVGSRRHQQTNVLVRARKLRELGGRMVNRLTHLVLLGHFRDTQCGLKGFQADIAKVVFERTRIDGFAFDVELFLIAELDQLSLREIPVAVENRAGSSVRVVADFAALVVDLFRIRRWAGEGVYAPGAAQLEILDDRA